MCNFKFKNVFYNQRNKKAPHFLSLYSLFKKSKSENSFHFCFCIFLFLKQNFNDQIVNGPLLHNYYVPHILVLRHALIKSCLLSVWFPIHHFLHPPSVSLQCIYPTARSLAVRKAARSLLRALLAIAKAAMRSAPMKEHAKVSFFLSLCNLDNHLQPLYRFMTFLQLTDFFFFFA